jgi:hypothetical protein
MTGAVTIRRIADLAAPVPLHNLQRRTEKTVSQPTVSILTNPPAVVIEFPHRGHFVIWDEATALTLATEVCEAVQVWERARLQQAVTVLEHMVGDLGGEVTT